PPSQMPQHGLLVFGEVLEIVWQPTLDLLPAIALGILEDLAALVAHAFEAAAHSVHARSEATLQHRHLERQDVRLNVLGSGGLNRLVLDVARECIVEVELVTIELELGRTHVAVCKELLDLAGLRIGEGNERLL